MKIINRICPNFTVGLDDRLCEGVLTPNQILILRGLYDSTHETPLVPDSVDVRNLTDEEIKNYSEALLEFKKEINREDLKHQEEAMLGTKGNNYVKALLTLDSVYDGSTRMRRIDMIAELAYRCITNFRKDKGISNLSYQEIVDNYFNKGVNLFYPGNGIEPKYTVLGQLTIRRNGVKARLDWFLENDPENKEVKELTYIVEELNKIINLGTQIYPALCIYSLSTLKDSIDLKIKTDFTSVEANTEINDEGEVNPSITENPTKESWQEVSKTSFNWLSKPVRQVLYMINSYDAETKTPLKDDLGFTIYEDALSLHRQLMDILVYVDSEEDMMIRLLEAGEANPSFKEVIKRLVNNPALKSDFFQAYSSYTHIDYEYSSETGNRPLSGIGSTKRSIFKAWLSRLSKSKKIYSTSILGIGNDNRTHIFTHKFKDFKEFVTEYFVSEEEVISKMFTRKKPSKFSKLPAEQKKAILSKVLEYLNIDYSPSLINTLITKKRPLDSISRELVKLVTNDWFKENTFDSQDAASVFQSSIGGVTFIQNAISNILYTITKNSPTRLDHKTNWLGKKLFNDILPSLMSDVVDTFKKFRYANSLSGIREFLDTEYFISSQFKDSKLGILNRTLKDLYESIYPKDYTGTKDPKLEECAEAIIDALGIIRNLGSKTKEFSDFTSSEHLGALMSGFFDNFKQNPGIVYIKEDEYLNTDPKKLNPNLTYYIIDKPYFYKGVNKLTKHPRSQFANYSLFIAGDANQLKSIKLPVYSYEECVDALYKLAISEINAWKQSKALNEKFGSEEFNTSTIFGFFPEMQNNSTLIALLNNTIKDKGEITDSLKEIIKDEIKKGLNKEVSELSKIIQGNETLRAQFEKYIEAAENKEEASKTQLELFAANYAVALGTTIQLTMISPALFENVKDLQKRNKGQHSNGKKLHTKAWNPFRNEYFRDEEAIQKTIIGEDPSMDISIINSEFMDYIEKLFEGVNTTSVDNYRKTKIADGQGFRLIDSYYKIRCMMGESGGDPKLHAWYAKYKELQARMRADGRTSFTKEELKELTDTGYIPQPLKPITQAIVKERINSSDTKLIAQQHKYAEICIIPEALPEGSRLKAIAEAMRGDFDGNWDNISKGICDIDLFIFDSGVKVGGYNKVKVMWDGDRQLSYNEVKEAVKTGYRHLVPLKYTRVQTNLPYHVHQARLLGSQIRKIMLAGIDRLETYSDIFKTFKFKTSSTHIRLSKNKSASLSNFTGNDFIKLYNALINAGYIESFQQFQDIIENNEELSRALIDSTILGSKGNINDVLAFTPDVTGEGFYNPLFDPIREHDSSGLIMSMYKKLVHKQTILGGMAVQASSFGISALEEAKNLKYVLEKNEDGENVVTYAEAEAPWDLSYTDANGNQIPLDYDTYCNENGTLKTNDKGEVLLDVDYPGMRDIIVYRTPTESFYSIVLIRVVRFTRPATTGGILKLNPEVIAQIGCDFDADKLAFLRKQFKEAKPWFKRVDITDDERDAIIRKVMEMHPEFIKEVEPITEESFSQSQLWEIFKNIYEENEEIYNALDRAREASGEYTTVTRNDKERTIYQHPLNYYFTKSETIAKIARRKGFESVEDYKAYLVQQSADSLGMVPENIVTVKDGYYALDDEAITQAGRTKRDVFEEAAEALGIVLKENINDRFIQYDPTKTPLQNNKIARNNLLLHLMQSRMLDTSETTARMKHTTGGFDKARKAARRLRELIYNPGKYKDDKEFNIFKVTTDRDTDPEPKRSPLSITTLLKFNEMNQIADKLIGVFANHNSNTIMSSLMEKLNLSKSRRILFGSFLEGENVLYRNGVKIGENDADKDNGLGYTLLADTIVRADGSVEIIADDVHECIAAAVDAVKDPVLNDLGLTITTATAGALLARLGYTFEDVGLLFNQPIVKEILRRMENNPNLDVVVSEILSEYKEFKPSSSPITIQVLKDGIVDQTPISKDRKDLSDQLHIMELFLTVMNEANKVNILVGITKSTSANSVASSYGQIIADIENTDRLLETFKPKEGVEESKQTNITAKPSDTADLPIINSFNLAEIDDVEQYLDDILDNPYAYEQCCYDCNKAVLYATAHLHPYVTDTYIAIRDAAASMSLYGRLDADLVDEIHKDIVLRTLALTGDSYFDAFQKMSNGKLFSEYLIKDFPTHLYEFLTDYENNGEKIKKLKEKYPLLDIIEFNPVINEEEESLTYRITIPAYKDGLKGFKYKVSSLFSDMFNAEDKPIRDLAKLLILNAYFTNGFGFTSTSFSEIFGPIIMHNFVINKEETTYVDVLNGLLNDSIPIEPKDMIIDFVRNHPTHEKFVYQIRSKSALKLISENKLFPTKFGVENLQTLTYDQAEKLNLIIGNKAKTFIYVNNKLWVLNSDSNEVEKGATLTYKELIIESETDGVKLYGNPNRTMSTEDFDVISQLSKIPGLEDDVKPSVSEMSLDEFSQKYSGYYNSSDIISIGEYKVDYKMALMAVLQRLSGRLFDMDSISKEEINNIIEEVYYKYTEYDLLEMLYEEYKKTGEILVLDENNKLIPLC